MPSPVGHALGGLAAGWLIESSVRSDASPLRPRLATLTFAALGMAADLDLLIGRHRGPSHSIGAVLLVGLIAWILTRRQRATGRLALACAAAYGSHLLLDWFGFDSSPPVGLQALWPLSAHYVQAPWPIFLPVSRLFFQPDQFWLPNARALGRELLVLVPIVAAIGYLRRRTPRARRAIVVAACAAGIAWLHGGATVAAVPPQQDDAQQSNLYVRAVATYLAGGFDGSLTAVAALTEADLADQARQLGKDARSIAAAALIHTELALRSDMSLDSRAALAHLARARRLIHDLRRVQTPGEFQRTWYLFLSAGLQSERALDTAEELLAEARALFPHDADLLTATAAALELRTLTSSRILPAARPAGRVEWRVTDIDREVQDSLESAARYLTEATIATPGQDEARLRLGRILSRLGQPERAVAELEIVRQRTPDKALRYLAAAFEGSVESGRARPDRAETLFEAALAAVHGQAASVGLSAAYYDQGRTADAARALQDLLRPNPDPDPWLAYSGGDAWHLEPRRALLRALVVRR